jgi:hypothetical protein
MSAARLRREIRVDDKIIAVAQSPEAHVRCSRTRPPVVFNRPVTAPPVRHTQKQPAAAELCRLPSEKARPALQARRQATV